MDRKKYIFIILSLTIILSLLYLSLLYLPQSHFINQLKTSINALETEINKKKNILAQLSTQHISPAKSEQPDETVMHTPTIDVPLFLKTISEMGETYDIHFLRFEPHPKTQKDHYSLTPFLIEVQGEFTQVLVFFDKITDPDKLVMLSNIDVFQAQQKAGVQLVRVEALLTHYQRL